MVSVIVFCAVGNDLPEIDKKVVLKYKYLYLSL